MTINVAVFYYSFKSIDVRIAIIKSNYHSVRIMFSYFTTSTAFLDNLDAALSGTYFVKTRK